MRLCLAVLAVCLSTVFAAPSLDRELDTHWQQWKDWHGRKYHEVSFHYVCVCIQFLKIIIILFCDSLHFILVEGRRMEANGLGEEPEKD